MSACSLRTPVALAAIWARKSPAGLVLGADLGEEQVETSDEPPSRDDLHGRDDQALLEDLRNSPTEAGAPPPTSTWCARFAT